MDQLLEVAFRAEDDGMFPMTWGQQTFWRLDVWQYDDAHLRNFNIPIVLDLPGKASPADQDTIVAVLRRLVERNQSLRAYFLDTRDGLFQQTAQSGTFSLRVRQSTPQASRASAETLVAELADRHFDHQAEWGIRFGLVCAGQSPRHFVFAVSHAVLDGGGVKALTDDFFDLLHGGEPVPRWQPSDQAGREQSERGDRRTRAAIKYWRAHLERIPPSMFTAPQPPEQDRLHRLRLDSPGLAVAAARLAAHCEASVANTLLAAACVALTVLSGQPTCVLMLIAGNRLDAELRSMVGQAAQQGLFAVSFSGGTIADAIRATSRAATSAYFHGQYEPAAIAELIETVAAERGVRFDLTLLYNDLGEFADEADDAGSQTGEADPRTLLRETMIVPEATWQGQICKLYLEAVPSAALCRLALVGDTSYLPLRTMHVLLRGIERIVLEAAYRDVELAEIPALTGLTPISAGQAR